MALPAGEIGWITMSGTMAGIWLDMSSSFLDRIIHRIHLGGLFPDRWEPGLRDDVRKNGRK